jgi:hypothetical protein
MWGKKGQTSRLKLRGRIDIGPSRLSAIVMLHALQSISANFVFSSGDNYNAVMAMFYVVDVDEGFVFSVRGH